ncbi:hypothetical protein J437_LFUL005707 [Ladona fulva]|uniref:Uncharacterized protein n=1 Tax=Ladona fulva TaxID=123851 RepID=A0A8K0K717_LADFU|nr:hypothetical protein J437_LFUL005707 [Ladona fulva]
MSSEIDEFVTAVSYEIDGDMSRYESFEPECERKCSDECNEIQDKSMNKSQDIFGSSANEEYLQYVLQKLSQDMVRIQKEIWVEKDMVEEELASYKEIQAILSGGIRKDSDVKRDTCTPLRERIKHSKQCAHRLIPSRTSRDSVSRPMPLMTPMMDPWFFKKTLRDAEKLCEIELERVRKCISVFSITPHTPEPSSHPTTERGSGQMHLSPLVRPGSSNGRSNCLHSKHKNTLESSENLRFSENLAMEPPKFSVKESKCELFNSSPIDEWSPASNQGTAISCNGDTNSLTSPTSNKKPDVREMFLK